jgi:hypothetical protein
VVNNALDSCLRERRKNEGILLIEIFAPFAPLVEVMKGDDEKGATGGGSGRADEFHIGLPRGLAGLMPVAGDTGTDHVFPGMLAAAKAWYDMVQGEVAALLTAILAGIFIAVEYLVAGHLSLAAGPVHELGKTDD